MGLSLPGAMYSCEAAADSVIDEMLFSPVKDATSHMYASWLSISPVKHQRRHVADLAD